jgi:hypothetical protein
MRLALIGFRPSAGRFRRFCWGSPSTFSLYDKAECRSGIDFTNRSILRLRVALLAPVIFLLRLAIAWSGQRSEGAGRRPPLLPAFVPACRRWVHFLRLIIPFIGIITPHFCICLQKPRWLT